ncbi:MAG: DUF72 domain-containing protein [Chitinophagaceae bacterium]|nr:MAG: DUF72 domain-containing protein [Chitinophagaceae bacterium]
MSQGRIWIGTSNVVVPGNKTSFPPEFRDASRLHYYSTLFNSVEINSSFYKVPLQNTFSRWSDDVVNDFRFSVKMHKEFTHTKNLLADHDLIDPFLQATTGLGEKKGALLVQFPGKITLDYFDKVESLLDRLKNSSFISGWTPVVEFRSPTWYIRETTELLDYNGASLVLQDLPKSKWQERVTRSPVVYMRFHGPEGGYRGSYGMGFLKKQAEEIVNWKSEGREVFVYFNNTIGNAFENALSLKAMVEG